MISSYRLIAYSLPTLAVTKRDDNGKLIVQKYIPPLSTEGVGRGQSDYHEQNTYGGIIMCQFDAADLREPFKIYSTKQYITR